MSVVNALYKSKDTGQDLGFNMNGDEAVFWVNRGEGTLNPCLEKRATDVIRLSTLWCVSHGRNG